MQIVLAEQQSAQHGIVFSGVALGWTNESLTPPLLGFGHINPVTFFDLPQASAFPSVVPHGRFNGLSMEQQWFAFLQMRCIRIIWKTRTEDHNKCVLKALDKALYLCSVQSTRTHEDRGEHGHSGKTYKGCVSSLGESQNLGKLGKHSKWDQWITTDNTGIVKQLQLMCKGK